VRSLHTSGHATLETIQKAVVAIQPKRIVPIHTFFPDRYRSVFNEPVLELQDGVPMQI
jgi:ribonuclease J